MLKHSFFDTCKKIWRRKNIFSSIYARLLKAYVNVIISKGKEHNISLLNLYDELGINPNNVSDYKEYTDDGLHFNDKGHLMLTNSIIRFLKVL